MAKPVIPALGRCEREAQEPAALLGYLLNLRTAWTMPDPVSEGQKTGGGRIEVRGCLAVVIRGWDRTGGGGALL